MLPSWLVFGINKLDSTRRSRWRETIADLNDAIIGGFLLTRQWRDRDHGLELVYWIATENGPARAVITDQEAVCFIRREDDLGPWAANLALERRPLALRSLKDQEVDGLYFKHQRDLRKARDAVRAQGITLLESDIKPSDRYLMERFVTGDCGVLGEPIQRDGYIEIRNARLARAHYDLPLRHVSIDIETEGLTGALYSIAAASPDDAVVFMAASPRTAPAGLPISWCTDERMLIQRFFAWLKRADPDLLLGWNIVGFDLDFLERKCAEHDLPFAIGRGNDRATILQPETSRGMAVARIPGRVALDGIELLRAGFWAFESFELDVVANQLLGRGKTIHNPHQRLEEIRRMYREDPVALATYNLDDCRLVLDIFDKANLLAFARERAAATGLAMDRYGGSVAAVDHLYLPRLHRAGFVAPDVGDVSPGAGSPGGYVIDSKPGLYDNVLLLDFKSLYPSIIRTFHIDPLALVRPGDDPVPGFDGASFSRAGAILPELVAELWSVRDRAKADGHAALSQAVKILMNSLYGVLGATGCRFFDSRLTSSITRRGHEIIQKSRDVIEEQGHQVIYGDTDSLFILPREHGDEAAIKALGTALAETLNDWWRRHITETFRLTSYLDIEFETHFLRFLMPTIRGAETGSKKRYAGLIRNADGELGLVFKGLESVRTDWTPLARRFQRELYRRIFLNEPFDGYIRDTLEALRAGELDAELVYRKRLRRDLKDYTRNVPPHVQAARKLDRPERWIRYVITRHGPEPVIDAIPKPDYQHYEQRQLAPVADGILGFVETSFEAIAGDQLELFADS
ncbi:MAG: DNA polymerase II [Geminicoccaceae bacterium]